MVAMVFMLVSFKISIADEWCKDDKRQQIAQEVSKSIQNNVYLYRREDLEELLLIRPGLLSDPNIKIEQIKQRCIQVFDVKNTGYHVRDGRIVGMSLRLPEGLKYRIAYDYESNTIYHLAGFADRREGFNGLSKIRGIRCESENDAVVLRAIYVTLCNQDSRSVDVWDEISLMSAVIRQRTQRITQNEFIKKWKRFPLE